MKSKRLRIIYLDFDDIRNPLLAAGQARATVEVGKRLVEKGHKVTVVCSRYPGYKDRKEFGMYYKHIGIGTGNIKLNNLLYILFLPFTVVKLQGDVVIECFTAPISTLFSPLFTKIPVVALPSMFNAREFEKKYRLPFSAIEKFGLKFYKYILPYSDVDEGKVKSINPQIQSKIVKQGVGEEYLIIKRQSAKHILFLSRFDIEQKGIDLLLKAYAKVKKDLNLPLVIAGHGPDENKIKKLINGLKIENSVVIAGSAYGEKKEKLMKESLFVAFPSRHDELSLWTLEAMAASLPIVCFDIPESKWMDDNVSLKAKPFNVSEYAKAMVLAADEKKNRQMGLAAKKLAKKFSWSKVVDEIEDFLFHVVEYERKTLN